MILTKKELAEKLKISTRTIDRMIRRGMPKLKYEYTVRFIWEDVENWLKNDTEKR